jgi:hypothetical protein
MFAATVAAVVHVDPAFRDRWIRNPSSLLDLSAQVDLTAVLETGLAIVPVGAAGTGEAGVVPQATLENAE